jgi:hypothetical protein
MAETPDNRGTHGDDTHGDEYWRMAKGTRRETGGTPKGKVPELS